ncbi:MAG: hypothetical protein PVH40_04460 [Gemmatimonadales bacterium]
MTPRTTRVTSSVAGLLAFTAIALQLIPIQPSLPDVPLENATSLPRPADPSQQAAALLTYEQIVRTNPFDPDRAPPSERYVPPELRAAQQPSRPSAPAAPRLQLFGVATGPTGAVALIDANASIPGAEIYRIGDLVSNYRLESISDTLVVLRNESGVRTLRLESPTGRSR